MSFFPLAIGRPKAFALDFSDMTVQLLEVHGHNHGLRATSQRHLNIPDGLIENGVILDQQAVAEILQKLVAESQPEPPKSKKVVAELPESQTFIHHFSIPIDTPKNEFQDAVLQQVGNTMPINLDEFAWDLQILHRSTTSIEVLFAAAPAEIAASYEQTLLLAGLELVVLEPESMALSRALISPDALKNGACVSVLDLGGRGSTLIFEDQAGLRLSVTRPEGGRSISQHIAKKLKVTEKAAEQRKCEKGLEDPELKPAIQEALAPIIEEFQAASEYYQQINGQPVSQLVLAGGTSRLKGLSEELQEKLGIPVGLGIPPIAIDGVDPQQLAVLSGLAMRASSLLPGINFIVPAG